MKNKKRILALFGVFLALMSVITPLCVYAEDDTSAQTVTELAGSSWYISNYTYSGSNQGYIVSGQLTYSGGTVTLPYPTTLQLKSTELSFGNGGWDDNISISVSDWCIIRFDSVSASGSSDLNILTILFNEYGTQLKVDNLTDTTWTVASGWEAEAGYGEFDINVNYDGTNYNYFYIGYGITKPIPPTEGSLANSISFGYGNYWDIRSDISFEVTFAGGTDTTNPKLIAWLSKFGQLQGSEDPEPDTDTFTFLTVGGDEFVYTYEVGMTWAEWAESEYNTFTNSYFFTVYTPSDNSVRVLADLFVTAFTHTSNGYRVVCYEPADGGGDFVYITAVVESRTYQATLLYDVGLAGYNSYIASYDAGYDVGFREGMIQGRQEGFDSGFNEASSKDFGKNLLGDTLNVPIDALNSFVLFSSGDTVVTLGGVVGVIIALFLFIMFLKMFAGG